MMSANAAAGSCVAAMHASNTSAWAGMAELSGAVAKNMSRVSARLDAPEKGRQMLSRFTRPTSDRIILAAGTDLLCHDSKSVHYCTIKSKIAFLVDCTSHHQACLLVSCLQIAE